MTLSARSHRILTEIEDELAAAEPRLDRALVQARLPALRCRSTLVSGDTEGGHRIWVVAIYASLLAGIGLLTAGLVLHTVTLFYAGVPLAQSGPVAAGYFGKELVAGAATSKSQRIIRFIREVTDVGTRK